MEKNKVTTGIPQGEEPTSKIDLLTGKYTKDIIVGILIIAILLLLLKSGLSEKVSDRLLDGLLALIGFFAGSKIKE
jgi:hypothetical protein